MNIIIEENNKKEFLDLIQYYRSYTEKIKSYDYKTFSNVYYGISFDENSVNCIKTRLYNFTHDFLDMVLNLKDDEVITINLKEDKTKYKEIPYIVNINQGSDLRVKYILYDDLIKKI